MNMRGIKIIVLIALLASLAWQAHAMEFYPEDFSYVIHLYYDGKKLVPDNSTRFQYDVIVESFEQQTVNPGNPYSGKIISVKNEILATFLFDPKYVGSPIGRGPLDVKAPYFSNAKTINLFDDTGKQIMAINASETVVCNENNVCDASETYFSCPSDCKSQPLFSPAVSETPVQTESGSKTMLWLILGAIGIIVVVISTIVRRRHRGQESSRNIMTSSMGKPSDGGSQTPNVPQP